MVPPAAPLIKVLVAFHAFVIRIVLVLMDRHQMIFDRFPPFRARIHLATARIETLAASDHRLLGIQYAMFIGNVLSVRLSRIEPLRTLIALKASELRVVMLRDHMRFHSRFRSKSSLTIFALKPFLLQMDGEDVLSPRISVSESHPAVITLIRFLPIVSSQMFAQHRFLVKCLWTMRTFMISYHEMISFDMDLEASLILKFRLIRSLRTFRTNKGMSDTVYIVHVALESNVEMEHLAANIAFTLRLRFTVSVRFEMDFHVVFLEISLSAFGTFVRP